MQHSLAAPGAALALAETQLHASNNASATPYMGHDAPLPTKRNYHDRLTDDDGLDATSGAEEEEEEEDVYARHKTPRRGAEQRSVHAPDSDGQMA